MADLHSAPTPPPAAGHDAAKTTLAAGSLLAAFGVAACCALPVALGAFGIGSAALFGIAALVGPYQVYVLAVAVLCLLGAGLVMWHQRRARICATAGACTRPALDRLTRVSLALALGLLALSFWIEPPI